MTNDEVGDIAEIYLEDVNNDDAEKLGEMLTETFNRWAVDTGNTPNIFSVVNIKRYNLSQINIDCHQCHFAARIPAWGNKEFLGCICPPYKGKICCEMKKENKCPLKNSKKDVGLESAIGEAIGEMKSVDRIVKKNITLEKALELSCRDSAKYGINTLCHDCKYSNDEKLNHCWECGVKYYKCKAGIDKS